MKATKKGPVPKRTPRSADELRCIPPLDGRLIPAHPTARQRAALRETLREHLEAARAALEDAHGYLAGSDPESALAALCALHDAAAAGVRAGDVTIHRSGRAA